MFAKFFLFSIFFSTLLFAEPISKVHIGVGKSKYARISIDSRFVRINIMANGENDLSINNRVLRRMGFKNVDSIGLIIPTKSCIIGKKDKKLSKCYLGKDFTFTVNQYGLKPITLAGGHSAHKLKVRSQVISRELNFASGKVQKNYIFRLGLGIFLKGDYLGSIRMSINGY